MGIEKLERLDLAAEKIMSILQNGNENYIFGCGWMGQNFLKIAQLLGNEIKGFLVSEKKETEVLKFPIYEKEELPVGKKRNIFVALRDQNEELNHELGNYCEVLCPITYPTDITTLEGKYYLDYFRQKGVDCTADLLVLNGYLFDNPFEQSYDYMLSWFYEAGDLILPVLYEDYTRIDEGPYETENTKLEVGDVVFDCGANIGLFSIVAMKKGCRVYAFEPMPEAISSLKTLQKRTGEELIICPYALSDRKGQAVFHVQNFDLLGASLLKTHNMVDKEYMVNITTVDDYVKEHRIEKVDYIKADIEGSERDMLKGAEETIQRFSPKLSICTYHLEDDKQVLESRIHTINPSYVIEHRWKKIYAYVP